MKIVVSACLLGENCKYSGGNNLKPELVKLLEPMIEAGNVIPVCPEVLGGLEIPRKPCEIKDGKVVNSDGESKDREYKKGAKAALKIAKECGAELAILQSRSPSCGVNEIYDGSFSGRKIPGKGVFAKLLDETEIQTVDVADIGRLRRCPVCGKSIFDGIGSHEICGVCGWENDAVQYRDPNFEGGANTMSLNQARAVYFAKNGGLPTGF